jgi:hypothetical protein
MFASATMSKQISKPDKLFVPFTVFRQTSPSNSLFYPPKFTIAISTRSPGSFTNHLSTISARKAKRDKQMHFTSKRLSLIMRLERGQFSKSVQILCLSTKPEKFPKQLSCLGNGAATASAKKNESVLFYRDPYPVAHTTS